MFMPFTITQDTKVHFIAVSLTLWLGKSVDYKSVFVFVGDVNDHHSEWLESISPTDRHGCDALNCCNLSGCEQLVHCPTYIADNRLVLLM